MSNSLVPTDGTTEGASVKPKKSAKRRNQRGMTTAEYAVGTVASVTVVGILISILNSSAFKELLQALLKVIFELLPQIFTQLPPQ